MYFFGSCIPVQRETVRMMGENMFLSTARWTRKYVGEFSHPTTAPGQSFVPSNSSRSFRSRLTDVLLENDNLQSRFLAFNCQTVPNLFLTFLFMEF